jgi:hypothetical protein
MTKDVKKTDTDKKKQKAEPDKVNACLHLPFISLTLGV